MFLLLHLHLLIFRLNFKASHQLPSSYLYIFLQYYDIQDVYMVTHLMGADLNNIVKTQKLSDDHVQFLVYQILRGLKYIHSAGIIHRVC